MNQNKTDFLFAISNLSNKIEHFHRACERELGMGLAQWCLLKKLVDLPGCSAQTLAKAVGVHPSSLTQTLKRLQKKGHIVITSDPSDSRKKTISITRNGKEAIEKESILSNFYDVEFKDFGKQITNILNNL